MIVEPSRCGQDRLYWFDRCRPYLADARRPASGKKLSPRIRRQVARSLSSTTPTWIACRRGCDRRHLVQPGASVLCRISSPGSRGGRGRAGVQASGPHGDPPHGGPAGQVRGHGRHHRTRPTREDPGIGGPGSRGRGHGVATLVERSPGGVVLSAYPLHRGVTRLDHRPGRDLRPGRRDDDLPDPVGSRGPGERHPVRPGREPVDREREPGPRRGAPHQGPARSGSIAPTSSTRRPASADTGNRATGAKGAARA